MKYMQINANLCIPRGDNKVKPPTTERSDNQLRNQHTEESGNRQRCEWWSGLPGLHFNLPPHVGSVQWWKKRGQVNHYETRGLEIQRLGSNAD